MQPPKLNEADEKASPTTKPVIEVKPLVVVAPPQPPEPPKKPMSKKERKAKKEEDRRAKLAQERNSVQDGNLLRSELAIYEDKYKTTKRGKSVEMKFKDLELSKKVKNPNQRATPILPAAIN